MIQSNPAAAASPSQSPYISGPAADIDPVVAHDAYAVACDQGLSSRRWYIGAAGAEVMTAERPRDPWRSLLLVCMAVVAVGGAGGFAAILMLGQTATTVFVSFFLSCLAAVILLAPVVALRRPQPVTLRDTESGGAALLTIHRRSRLALSHVTYEIRTPLGSPLGELTHDPVSQIVRTSWRIRPHEGEIITLTEPSLSRALRQRTIGRSLMLNAAAAIFRSRASRRGEQDRAPRRATLHAVRDGAAEPLARMAPDDSPRWTWIVFHPATEPHDRYLILAAILLVIAEENA